MVQGQAFGRSGRQLSYCSLRSFPSLQLDLGICSAGLPGRPTPLPSEAPCWKGFDGRRYVRYTSPATQNIRGNFQGPGSVLHVVLVPRQITTGAVISPRVKAQAEMSLDNRCSALERVSRMSTSLEGEGFEYRTNYGARSMRYAGSMGNAVCHHAFQGPPK
jgi:hypothetical protein